jgi:acetate kinase
MKILVLNAGSSTVKFGVIGSDGERTLLDGQADWSCHPEQLVVRRPGAAPETSTLEAVGAGPAITHILKHLSARGADGGDVAAAATRWSTAARITRTACASRRK